MELKDKLQTIFNGDYPGNEVFICDVVRPILGDEINYVNINLTENPAYHDKADKAGIKHLRYVADIVEQDCNADNIVLFDVTLYDKKNIERSRVNIQQLIRLIVQEYYHILMVFHYEDVEDKPWRFSYAYKQDTLANTTSAKRYTYVFGRGYRGRTAAERFEVLAKSSRNNEDFKKAFSVAALSDEFFEKYRNIYADFVQYITGKRYEKIKNKWKEVKKNEPNSEIFSQFNNDDKRVRDYIKKMMGRLTFLCFLQRKGWMNNDRNFLQNLYQSSPLQVDFLDAVLEPLFFGVLNTLPVNRKKVFAKNGWDIDLADEWKEIPYLNGGLFEQTREDKLSVKFPKDLFFELFKFLGEYNFTIDENDPDDAEIGIDPEMLGRVFESLLEDNKDKGAFYTPKEIVQYMCRQSIIEHLKTHTVEALHADIEDLINKGLVNHALQNRENARTIHKLLKEVTVCDPAIGSGAFPMGILNILFTTRQHLYGFLHESEPFNPLEVKKSIIRDNIYGVDIEQGAVDIARLRFWLAILVEEQVATPLPNLDYRIVRGNSLISTFNDEYIKLPENPDGRTKLAKLKKELHQLQNDLFDLNGDKKLQREIDIKRKILEIIKIQLGIDKANAQEESKIETDIFEEKKLSGKALKKAQNAHAIEVIKGKCMFTVNSLQTSLTTPATSLADRAQIDIKFFDWKILFSNIFNEGNNSGFDIVIGNPPYLKEGRASKNIFTPVKSSPYYKGKMDIWYMFACQGIDMLKPEGNLCFIATNNWITSDGASKLRNKVTADAQILQMCDFRSYMIFDSASIQTMIMQFKRSNQYEEYKFDLKNLLGSTLKDVIMLLNRENGETTEFLTPKFVRNQMKDKFFTFGGNNDIFTKISKGKIYLNDSEIANGIHPHYDFINKKLSLKFGFPVNTGIFGLSSEELVNLELDSTERELIKPYINNSSTVHRYFTEIDPNLFIIYTGSKFKNPHSMDNYPRLKAHLDKFTNVISSDNKPYGLHRARKESFFIGEKIAVLRKCAGKPLFSYSNFNCYLSATFYIIDTKRVNMLYLTGLLNSKLIEFWLRNKGKMQGENFQLDAAPLKEIPIAVPEVEAQARVGHIVEEIIERKIVNNSASIQDLENQIDHIVYHLYDLTYNEVLIIDPQTPISREDYESFNLYTYGQS